MEYFERRARQSRASAKVCNFSHLCCIEGLVVGEELYCPGKKSFDTEEQLILPAAKDICLELFGKAAVIRVGHVPLSDNTVKRRIGAMAEVVESHLTDSKHPCGMPFKWTSPQTWKTKLFYLFMCGTSIKMICKRTCCVSYFFQQKDRRGNI